MIALERIDQRFANLKKIQNVFLNCYFKSENTKTLFENLTSNEKTDFSRYNYFFANYLNNIEQKPMQKRLLRNLKKISKKFTYNQYKIDFLRVKIIFNLTAANKNMS